MADTNLKFRMYTRFMKPEQVFEEEEEEKSSFSYTAYFVFVTKSLANMQTSQNISENYQQHIA